MALHALPDGPELARRRLQQLRHGVDVRPPQPPRHAAAYTRHVIEGFARQVRLSLDRPPDLVPGGLAVLAGHLRVQPVGAVTDRTGDPGADHGLNPALDLAA